MKKIFLSILFLLINSVAFADTTLTEDCSASAVNTAITNEAAGGTVTIGCESPVTWNAQINLSGGKTLSGGGTKSGASSTTTGTWPIVINITHAGTAAISITNANSQNVNRVTGFKFQGTGGPTYIISVVGTGTGTTGNGSFRIDNNYFNEPNYTTRVIRTDGSTGQMNGVVDHNVFYYKSTSSLPYGNIAYANNAHGGLATCYGYDSWQRAVGFGTSDFVFYEDNYFLNSGIETSEGGGRLVSRYNYYTTDYNVGISGLDGHGADTGGNYCIGIVAAEFYNNTLTGAGIAHAVNMRGGKWMVHDNTINNGVIQIDEYRLRSAGSLDWKLCSGTFCCPTTPAQCDVQQPTIDDFAACYPVLNQLQSTYLWSNSVGPTVYGRNATIAYYIAENREYWTASTGLAANLPGICTTGAGYWATDTSTMYKCTSTNTWTAFYTPYTYPHPLRGESDVTAPTATWTIDSTGLIATATFSETVNATTKTGVSFTGSVTGAIGATYKDGMPGGIVRYDLAAEVQQGETVVVDYTTPGDGIKDLAGNALADISDGAVSNNSTQADPPLVTLTIGAHAGSTVNVYPGINCGSTCGPVEYDTGTVLTVSVAALPNYTGCTIGGTGCGASTTMSEARSCTVTCTKIAPDYTLGSGAAVTIGSGAAATIQ